MLQEVHVEVIVTLHRFLYPQLKDVGEITGGVQAQINHRVSYAEGATKGGAKLENCPSGFRTKTWR